MVQGSTGLSAAVGGAAEGDASTVSAIRQGGLALVLACLPAVLGGWAYGASNVLEHVRLGLPLLAATLLLVANAALVLRRPRLGQSVGVAGAFALLGVLATALVRSPAASLAAVASAALFVFQVSRRPPPVRSVPVLGAATRSALRARAAGALAFLVLVGVSAFHRLGDPMVQGGTVAACGSAWLLAAFWGVRAREHGVRAAVVLLTGAAGASLLVSGTWSSGAWLAACLFACSATLAVPRPERRSTVLTYSVWDPIVSHPARLLISTFLGMALLGTLFLSMPWATVAGGGLDTVDAAFTSVSAVCVTGLIVLDTPRDFTVFGQVGILLLIQVGGLGIMSITTVVLHALGRRLSLSHERLLAGMSTESRDRLVQALRRVVVFAFGAELLGAVALTLLFAAGGETLGAAAYRGLFTSVSAFCNAGFALQTDSLIGYQDQPLVLHVVAALIVLGGLSPAVALGLGGIFRGRRLDPAARLVLIVTILLLFGGALVYGLFEWHGSLAGLSPDDRIHNAWFQSVTLRTAGFNSVDTAGTSAETQLLMMSLMFIGGSPGGTAGGIKTTTFAVLVLAVWAAITGRARVVVQGRQIGHATVLRAVAVLGTGVLIWLIVVVFLLLTQQVPAPQVVFEATSALGTVGLSTGATTQLDATGKIIVFVAMFLGRVGPLTLFTLLSEPRVPRVVEYPEATIPIA